MDFSESEDFEAVMAESPPAGPAAGQRQGLGIGAGRVKARAGDARAGERDEGGSEVAHAGGGTEIACTGGG